MKISRIKNIFVGMITTLAVAAGALNGCGQAANPAESTPNASSEALQEAASDTTSREQTIGKTTADESTDIGGEKITIRIASWYQESYLTNLKNYLSEEFPEYSFHYYIWQNLWTRASTGGAGQKDLATALQDMDQEAQLIREEE